MIPAYVQDDPALARVYDERASEKLMTKLSSRTVRDLLPEPQDRDELPVVDPDATILEVAAVMARMHSPLVAVVDGGRVAGGGDGEPTVRGALPRAAGRFVTQVLVVVAFATAYVLIATERIHRVAAALSGAAAMVVLGVVDAQVAFFSERTGVDWNVIFLLLGMMIIVGVLRQTGVFEYLAIVTAKRARGRPFVIMVQPDGAHRGGLRAAGQRDDRAAGGAGDPAGVRPDRSGPGAVPDRRGAGLQHRRYGDPGR